ncbi:arylsulfatase [Sporocytophaga myxococcoides]|uniref:arylsulfatase n=1 Tax=Sporocytophaga myxococcoides TaxID=153721 RepID=UPI000424242D|nr:arylsulfatase [Sporocytophaga myxococcoides]
MKEILRETTKLASMLVLGAGIALPAFSQNKTFEGTIGKTLSESKPDKVTYLKKAPVEAPNVIWILLDDVGFGASSAFGGLINTPTFDSLANNGLRYTNFHTTGICSPTRAALLTGRNHHSVHMGGFPHDFLSADFPGYDGHIPSEAGTVAETFRENGYNTYALGKWHLTPDDESSDLGPFDRWPSGKGFDHFYGFLSGATDQYKPDLVEDNKHVKPDGRHLNELIADKAISYISSQKIIAPDKPFFLYFSPGATHSPHQVAREWSDKYRGKFDQGWDKFREQILANQKKLGVVPATAQLPARNPRVKAWKDLKPEEQKIYARFMEVYAGFLEYTDHEIGRIVSHLKNSGQLENTAIFIVIGDNGASQEGAKNGVIQSEFAPKNAVPEDEILRDLLKNYEKIGSAETYTNYPIGWAQAANTPFKHWKQDANSEGGTRNPLIVFYPKGIKDKGTVRTQYGHLIDLFPTTVELTGIKPQSVIKGIQQKPIEGTSLAYSLNDASAASKHTVQYYNIFGSRAIYKDGWKAEAAHTPAFYDLISYPGENKVERNFDKDVWELYNLNEDFNERINLASKYPEKLQELKALFDAEARKYNVYPLIDWTDCLNRGSFKSIIKPNISEVKE